MAYSRELKAARLASSVSVPPSKDRTCVHYPCSRGSLASSLCIDLRLAKVFWFEQRRRGLIGLESDCRAGSRAHRPFLHCALGPRRHSTCHRPICLSFHPLLNVTQTSNNGRSSSPRSSTGTAHVAARQASPRDGDYRERPSTYSSDGASPGYLR